MPRCVSRRTEIDRFGVETVDAALAHGLVDAGLNGVI